MLVDMNRKPVTKMSHDSYFQKYRNVMGIVEFENACEEINTIIDSNSIHKAGWMPPKQWDGTAFQSIVTMFSSNKEEAGKFFGLMVYWCFMQRMETWCFYRPDKDKKGGMTYFMVKE